MGFFIFGCVCGLILGIIFLVFIQSAQIIEIGEKEEKLEKNEKSLKELTERYVKYVNEVETKEKNVNKVLIKVGEIFTLMAHRFTSDEYKEIETQIKFLEKFKES